MIARRTFLLAAFGAPVLAVAARPAFAGRSSVFETDGVAINGYDPVAYFIQSYHVKGSPDFDVMWRGVKWRFSTAQNRDAFRTAPENFAPQYGGYCAYAVAHGATAKTDPDAWTVHQGRLYLNFSIDVRGLWRQDISGFIARADANWPAVLDR